ncbi:MAG: LCP family protein, partial [Acidimicrobiia bacterium]
MSTSRGRRRRPPKTSPERAAILSALFPGWGQYAQGRPRRALPFLIGAATITILVLAGLTAGPTRIAGWLVDPTVLILLIVANVIVAVFRFLAVWDAGRIGQGRSALVVGTVVVLLVAIPHLALGWVQVRTYTFLTSVFAEDGGPVAAGSSTSSAPSESTGSPGADNSSPGATTSTAPATTTTSTVPWQGDERLNVLLLGGDAGPGRSGIRTDTMILASIGLKNGDVALFGFPRNLTHVTFADGSRFTGYQGILNEVYPYGFDNPDRFPGSNPGASALEQVIEGMAGVDIDYYVLVDLNAFVDIVDALGGVTMYVPREINDNEYPLENGTMTTLHIDAGVQHFDGSTGLAYVRSRHDSTDYDRMGRQRCFLSALAAEADVPSLVRGLPALLDTIQANVTTDIPLSALPDLIKLAGKVDATGALAVGFDPPDWISGRVGPGFPVPDVEKIRQAVALAIADPA